jgi:hypothetical protein
MAIQQANRFHPLPVIGHPDAFYTKHIKAAEEAGDIHARESHKVGRYITLAMDHQMVWEEKVRHFRHALKHHCNAPPDAGSDVVQFYEKLAELVRRHAGQEAVRFVNRENDAMRLRERKGTPRENLKQEAVELKRRVLGEVDACPGWMSKDGFEQVTRVLGQWQ